MQKIYSNKNQQLFFPKRMTDTFTKVLNYPMTVVVAPSGYGKTTAIREHITRSNCNILWQSVFDDSKINFWSSFASLFKDLDKKCFNNLIQLGFPEDSSSRRRALDFIENINFRKHTIIIIDDFHIVDTQEVVNFINFLVLNQIINLHIVLVSRFIKFINTEDLSLKGYLLLINKENLEFSQKEIVDYYSLCGMRLTCEQAKEVYSLTEGWISAIYLLMLNYKKNGELLSTLDIYKLIEEVVYEPFSHENKQFLISMSIFNSFTSEMARYMWPNVDIEKTLSEITSKNAFVDYDSLQSDYHIHNIFLGFLENKFELVPKSFKETLYKKASQLYLQSGDYIMTMKYAYLADDFDMLLKALVSDKGKQMNGEHRHILIKYYEETPLEIKKNNPFAVLMYAKNMFRFNEFSIFKKICDDFMTIISYTEIIKLPLKMQILGEYEFLICLAQYNDIEKMNVHIKHAGELLKEISVIFDNESSYTFGSPSLLYLYYRKSGELQKEVKILNESLYFYSKISGGNGKGADEIMNAEHFYLMGDFQNAEISMYKAYEKVTRDSGLLICVIFLNIKLSFIKGDLEDILKLFKKLHDAYEIKQYMFIQTIDICEAYFFTCLNTIEKIQPWIINGEFENTYIFTQARGCINIVYAEVLFVNAEYLKLIGISEQFLSIASIYPNILGLIYTYIYLAAANKRVFRDNEAIIALKQALSIAMPDKVYMPFVECYDYIKPVIEELYEIGDYKEDILKIIGMCIPYYKAKEYIIKQYYSKGQQLLTQRENEVALLASKGFSNKEIAKRLFISENTVKTQLKSIYGKLNINSRTLLKQKL